MLHNAESLAAEPTNTISPPVHSNGMKSVSASTHKLRGASPVLVFPTWTHITPGNPPSSMNGTTYSAELNTGRAEAPCWRSLLAEQDIPAIPTSDWWIGTTSSWHLTTTPSARRAAAPPSHTRSPAHDDLKDRLLLHVHVQCNCDYHRHLICFAASDHGAVPFTVLHRFVLEAFSPTRSTFSGSHSDFHLGHRVVSIWCEYRLELRLVSSAEVEHSRGDLTPSYSRSAAPVRDTVGETPPIHGSTMCITIQSSTCKAATVPSELPTIAPTAPTVIPTIKPSSAPQVLPCPRRPWMLSCHTIWCTKINTRGEAHLLGLLLGIHPRGQDLRHGSVLQELDGLGLCQHQDRM